MQILIKTVCLAVSFLLGARLMVSAQNQEKYPDFERDSLLAIKYYNIADTGYLNVDLCKRYTQLAMPLLKKTGQMENYLYCLAAMSYCYRSKAMLDSLEINNLFAFELAKKELPPYHKVFIAIHNNLGYVYGDVQQDYQKALNVYLEALSLFNEDNMHLGVKGTILNNIGKKYRHLGDFDNAILYHKEAISYYLKSLDDYVKMNVVIDNKFTEVYMAISKLYAYKGDFDTAQKYLEEGLAILNRYPTRFDANYFINSYLGLAEVSIQQGQSVKAKALLRKARKYPTLSNPQLATFHKLCATVHFYESDYTRALQELEEALQVVPEQLSLEKAELYHLQSQVFAANDQLSEARKSINLAIQVLVPEAEEAGFQNLPNAAFIRSRLELIEALHTKAQILRKQAAADQNSTQLEAALLQYQMISKLSDQIRQNYQSEESKLLLNSKAYRLYENAIEVCFQLWRQTRAPRYQEEAFFFFEKSKATALLDELIQKEASGTYSLPDTLKKRHYQLRAQINYLSKQLTASGEQKVSLEAKTISKWNSELLEARQAYATLQKEIQENYPNYHRLLSTPQLSSIESIQQNTLVNRQTFIEYFVGERHIYAFIISPLAVYFERTPKRAALTKNINAFLSDTKLNNAEGLFKQAAFAIYQQVLQPFTVPDESTNLIIVPDGILAFIPFELLLTKAPDATTRPRQLPYLIRSMTVSYAYSGTVLQSQQKTPITTTAILGMAPVFEQNSRKYLAYSETEILHLEALNSTTFLRQQASKVQFLKHWSDFGIVHLASHAIAEDSLQQQPAIEFWDEALYLSDLYAYNAQPSMVVLSACETGRGDLHSGEGVMSLARGFTYAGAASVITSLWNVNDQSTADIMALFYANLEEGMPKDEALKMAKLSYLDSSPDELAAPFYWGSFVQLGDNRALPLKRNWSWHYWLIGLIGIVGIFLVFRSLLVRTS